MVWDQCLSVLKLLAQPKTVSWIWKLSCKCASYRWWSILINVKSASERERSLDYISGVVFASNGIEANNSEWCFCSVPLVLFLSRNISIKTHAWTISQCTIKDFRSVALAWHATLRKSCSSSCSSSPISRTETALCSPAKMSSNDFKLLVGRIESPVSFLDRPPSANSLPSSWSFARLSKMVHNSINSSETKKNCDCWESLRSFGLSPCSLASLKVAHNEALIIWSWRIEGLWLVMFFVCLEDIMKLPKKYGPMTCYLSSAAEHYLTLSHSLSLFFHPAIIIISFLLFLSSSSFFFSSSNLCLSS